MKTIELTKEELYNIFDTETCVKTSAWEYGKIEDYVFKKGINNYLIQVYLHRDEGLMLEMPLIARKVKPITKTVVDWEYCE